MPSADLKITAKIAEGKNEDDVDYDPGSGYAEDHSVLQGRYSIGEELGYGGYATVRLGSNLKTEEQVAVKIIYRKGGRPIPWDSCR